MKTVSIGTETNDVEINDEVNEEKKLHCSFLLYDPNIDTNESIQSIIKPILQVKDVNEIKDNFVLQGYHPLLHF